MRLEAAAPKSRVLFFDSLNLWVGQLWPTNIGGCQPIINTSVILKTLRRILLCTTTTTVNPWITKTQAVQFHFNQVNIVLVPIHYNTMKTEWFHLGPDNSAVFSSHSSILDSKSIVSNSGIYFFRHITTVHYLRTYCTYEDKMCQEV